MNELVNKMTKPMLWTIIVPIASLIVMLTILAGAYARVVWKSDQVSYEGALGKFTANASNLQTKLNNALEANRELLINANNIEKTLGELEKICKLPTQSGFTSGKENVLSDKFIDLKNNLTQQSSLLSQQKIKLEAVSKDISQFKETLQRYSNKESNAEH